MLSNNEVPLEWQSLASRFGPLSDTCRIVTLGTFITSTFGISQREQKEILERISDAVADTVPAVREVMKSPSGFKDTGKRMLAAWSEGVSVLRDSRMYGLSPWKSAAAFEGISDPPKLKNPRTVIGRAELLAHRTKSKSK